MTTLTMAPTRAAAPGAPRHPLEPLSAGEVARAVEILRGHAPVTPATRFVSVTLREPTKQALRAGDVPGRRAEAVLFDNAANACYEALVGLESGAVESFRHVPGVQPTMTIDEQVECEQAVLTSELFRAKLREHYPDADPNLLMVDIWSAGYYGDPADAERRWARPLCFLRSDPTDNGYAHPVEGLRPVVDLNTMTVVRVEEYGRWPLPPCAGNYAAERVGRFRDGIKPLVITQPEGPSFGVQGNVVRWQNWHVVVGFSAREGLTLHDIRYDDNGRDRPILHRASLTEMVVPYGDPGPTQARKNAFDVGEYGMGMCANSLVLGCDCLGHIRYFDAHLCDSRGGPITIPNAVCMHEEDYGTLWKHTDRRFPDKPEVRRSRRLVISSVSTVENYEYGFFWYFYQDGNIGFEIKLTGILSLAAVRDGDRPEYGAVIAPNLYAPNHQHFFNVRLDFDIDGGPNTVYRVDVAGEEVGPNNPFGNAFSAKATPLRTESEACANVSVETARAWKVVNPSSLNAVGQPAGYKFLPGDNCAPFASREAHWRKRAGFADHHVWVTPFHEGERFAAGDYPNQSTGGDGLPRWVAQDRKIENADVVFWYTFGHTHIPRPEDYPVMPTAYIGFLLKPNGFFDLNPANDVPPSAPKSGAAGLPAAGNGAACCGG